MILNMLIAGFGGQGVLFMGKVAAYTAMVENKQVSWLPSYGPEMRGGTANCSVCIDDEPIGCPLVLEPETLVVLNAPSYDKFVDAVQPGGKIFIDSALISAKCTRTDIEAHYIPCTQMAKDEGLDGLANIIMLGKVLKETGFTTYEVLCEAMKKCVPAKKAHLLDANLKAIKLGYEYQE